MSTSRPAGELAVKRGTVQEEMVNRETRKREVVKRHEV
jgi:hypothetical protein